MIKVRSIWRQPLALLRPLRALFLVCMPAAGRLCTWPEYLFPVCANNAARFRAVHEASFRAG